MQSILRANEQLTYIMEHFYSKSAEVYVHCTHTDKVVYLPTRYFVQKPRFNYNYQNIV